jgi:hypothetical protein
MFELPLAQAPEAYEKFDKRADGYTKSFCIRRASERIGTRYVPGTDVGRRRYSG